MQTTQTCDNWRYNIPIGSKIIINNTPEVYIFYGYNHDQSLASCFPINSSCMIDNMIFIPLENILSTHNNENTTLESAMESKLKI